MIESRPNTNDLRLAEILAHTLKVSAQLNLRNYVEQLLQTVIKHWENRWGEYSNLIKRLKPALVATEDKSIFRHVLGVTCNILAKQELSEAHDCSDYVAKILYRYLSNSLRDREPVNMEVASLLIRFSMNTRFCFFAPQDECIVKDSDEVTVQWKVFMTLYTVSNHSAGMKILPKEFVNSKARKTWADNLMTYLALIDSNDSIKKLTALFKPRMLFSRHQNYIEVARFCRECGIMSKQPKVNKLIDTVTDGMQSLNQDVDFIQLLAAAEPEIGASPVH